jgi:hypothetical protein
VYTLFVPPPPTPPHCFQAKPVLPSFFFSKKDKVFLLAKDSYTESFLALLPCTSVLQSLILQFCWRESIGDNRKDIALLLVWDNDNYTEWFLALLPCTCALLPTLVCLYQTSSLLPGPLPIVGSASLRLLYSFLYSEHINHIQFLGFLYFPHISCACSPLSVWSISNNITAFVFGLKNLFWCTYLVKFLTHTYCPLTSYYIVSLKVIYFYIMFNFE